MTLDGVYARACAAVPELAAFVAPGSLPGAVLADPRWLDDRVTAAADKWSVADRRAVGTIWWYSASSTLLAPPVTTLVVAGRAADPALDGLTLGLRPDGYLSGARARALLPTGPDPAAAPSPAAASASARAAAAASSPAAASASAVARGLAAGGVGGAAAAVPGLAAGGVGGAAAVAPRLAAAGLASGAGVLGEALRGALGAVIAPLSEVSGATERALWAIATDSLATWALRAGAATADVDRAVDVSLAVARAVGPVMPVPRYVEIPVTPPRRYVRRASCCLIYEAPDCDKCTSCPRRPPADRLQRLTAHALSTQ